MATVYQTDGRKSGFLGTGNIVDNIALAERFYVMASARLGGVVLPGDDLTGVAGEDSGTLSLRGPGVLREASKSISCKPGILKESGGHTLWIDSRQKRYIPAKSDNVIGIVVAKAGDTFKVDIGSSEQASLSYLAFEGATKRNRPDVKIGDLVFARLLVAGKDVEPELVCIDSSGKSNGYGVVGGTAGSGSSNGFLVHIPLHVSRKLLHPDYNLLKVLGKQLPFESAVGINGRVWVNGRSPLETLLIANLLSTAEAISSKQVKSAVDRALCR